ncbi:MAG: UDP-N-acetylmuramoyl-L-alanyl-D-glutamate--2,6-diaminopimelate ligase [Rikenellaceae bacterium]
MNINLSKTTSIEFDSRKVKQGSLFVAVRGTLTDGHLYIDRAIEMGAQIIVCEDIPQTTCPGVEYIQVKDCHSALSQIAGDFYSHPSLELSLVGVTGTNGKTTTATMLYHLFRSMGYKCGLLSTVENRINDEIYPSTHTTPDAVELNALLRKMVTEGCTHCFMEVSSHAMVQRRVEGLHFSGGIFTNLTHDHLDYHGTFSEYLKAKKSFFDMLPSSSFALTNKDDRNGEVMLQNCKAAHRTYSLRSLATYNTKIIESHLEGMQLRINGTEVWVQFLGKFNGYNLTAIYATAIELGEDSDKVLEALSKLTPVAGRFETIRSTDGRLAVVDYAHTPDALKSTLQTIVDVISESRGGGRIITVVGCGGDRDNTKRPVMASIAAQLSHQVILTSDNPRSEDPYAILSEMEGGLSTEELQKTLTIENRASAIKTATTLAKSGDIILIAGKGHETYQEIKGVRTHFDDREEARRAFGI